MAPSQRAAGQAEPAPSSNGLTGLGLRRRLRRIAVRSLKALRRSLADASDLPKVDAPLSAQGAAAASASPAGSAVAASEQAATVAPAAAQPHQAGACEASAAPPSEDDGGLFASEAPFAYGDNLFGDVSAEGAGAADDDEAVQALEKLLAEIDDELGTEDPLPVAESPAPQSASNTASSGGLTDAQRALMAGFSPPGQTDAAQERHAAAPAPSSGALRDQVIAAIHEVYDPEIPVDVYELGLIYEVDIDADLGTVDVQMTLTSPNCPSAQQLPEEVRMRCESVEGIRHADVEVVFDPPWSPELMSEEAKLLLNV